MERIDRINGRLSTLMRQRESALEEVQALENKLAFARETLAQWEEARKIIQHAAATVQESVHDQIAGVVSRCLAAIWTDPYQFHIDFDRKRGKTEARLYFKRGENEVDPLEAAGIGVVDVASFALRLAAIKLHQPPLAQVLILDEPMKHLQPSLRPKVAELFKSVSEDMGVQIIVITHDKAFMIGNVIEVK